MIWYEMISDLAMKGAAMGTSPGGGHTVSSATGHCPGHSHLISWSPDILATVLVTVTDMRHVEEHGMKLDLWLVQSGHVTWILTSDWSRMFTAATNTKESQTTWSPDHLMSQVTRYAADESTKQFVWWLCVLLLVEKHHTYSSPPDQTPWLVPWLGTMVASRKDQWCWSICLDTCLAHWQPVAAYDHSRPIRGSHLSRDFNSQIPNTPWIGLINETVFFM